jgi:hypothetical protein
VELSLLSAALVSSTPVLLLGLDDDDDDDEPALDPSVLVVVLAPVFDEPVLVPSPSPADPLQATSMAIARPTGRMPYGTMI